MGREQILQRLREIREEAVALRDELRSLSEADELTDEQRARFEELVGNESPIDALERERADLQRRLDVLERAERLVGVEEGEDRGAPQYMRRTETDVDPIRATRREVRDAALAVLEREADTVGLATRQGDQVDRLLRRFDENVHGDEIARRLLLTENDDYRSAFMKAVTAFGRSPAFTPEEAAALERFESFRAMSLNSTQGGYGVPVLIDPTIILTSGAADAPILRIARVEVITTNEWKGVSSAGVSWSYDGADASGTEVSDDSPTLDQPTVGTNTARGFIPYGIEIGQDYPSFAEEMMSLLNQGYVDLLAQNTLVGNTTNVTGIFTALLANTNVQTVVTTAGTLSGADILRTWKNLPERYRSRASWVMSVDVENAITALGDDADAFYTNNLTEFGVPGLRSRPVYTSDYAPAMASGTTAGAILVVGDFSNFLIAQRAGMTVELVPHLFGVTTGRPVGQRGWFAWARNGFDSINDRGFQLLINKTS